MNIVDSINSILSFLDGQNPLTHQLAELFSCCKITHFFSFRTYFFVIFFRGSVWLIFSMIFLYFILIKSIQGGMSTVVSTSRLPFRKGAGGMFRLNQKSPCRIIRNSFIVSKHTPKSLYCPNDRFGFVAHLHDDQLGLSSRFGPVFPPSSTRHSPPLQAGLERAYNGP